MWQLGTWDDKSSWWYQKLGMGPNAGIFMNTKLVAAHGCSSCVQKVPSVVIDPYPKHVPRGQTSGHDFVSDDTSSGINHALPVINACLLYKPKSETYRWSTPAVTSQPWDWVYPSTAASPRLHESVQGALTGAWWNEPGQRQRWENLPCQCGSQ
jgi:hypothetical protein